MNSAIDRLAEWIESERTRLRGHPPVRFRGREWWQLTRAEAWAFALTLEDMPHIVPVYHAYHAVLDIVCDELAASEACAQARTACSWLSQGAVERREWLRFAALFGVPNRKAAAFFAKIEWLEVRAGLVTYQDEIADDLPFPK